MPDSGNRLVWIFPSLCGYLVMTAFSTYVASYGRDLSFEVDTIQARMWLDHRARKGVFEGLTVNQIDYTQKRPPEILKHGIKEKDTRRSLRREEPCFIYISLVCNTIFAAPSVGSQEISATTKVFPPVNWLHSPR